MGALGPGRLAGGRLDRPAPLFEGDVPVPLHPPDRSKRGIGSAGHPEADAPASTVVTKRMPLFVATRLRVVDAQTVREPTMQTTPTGVCFEIRDYRVGIEDHYYDVLLNKCTGETSRFDHRWESQASINNLYGGRQVRDPNWIRMGRN